MRATDDPTWKTLHHLATGFYDSQALSVAADLGIADMLTEGARSGEDLARATSTDAPSLHRLLRALASVDVFDEVEPDRFALTSTGAWLQSDIAGSLRPVARLFGSEHFWRAWGDLSHCVRTGELAFPHVFGMRNLFEYYAQHPEILAIFQAAMSTYAAATEEGVVAYDFATVGTVVDVGGGQGELLAAILGAHRSQRGVLFAARCDVVGGDFFAAVPAGGDLYLLSRVLHDWDDERAITILRTCRRAVRVRAKLLLVEFVLPTRVTRSWSAQTQLLGDLNMLVQTGGHERTEDEYRALLAASGWELARVIPADAVMSLVEGVTA